MKQDVSILSNIPLSIVPVNMDKSTTATLSSLQKPTRPFFRIQLSRKAAAYVMWMTWNSACSFFISCLSFEYGALVMNSLRVSRAWSHLSPSSASSGWNPASLVVYRINATDYQYISPPILSTWTDPSAEVFLIVGQLLKLKRVPFQSIAGACSIRRMALARPFPLKAREFVHLCSNECIDVCEHVYEDRSSHWFNDRLEMILHHW